MTLKGWLLRIAAWWEGRKLKLAKAPPAVQQDTYRDSAATPFVDEAAKREAEQPIAPELARAIAAFTRRTEADVQLEAKMHNAKLDRMDEAARNSAARLAAQAALRVLGNRK